MHNGFLPAVIYEPCTVSCAFCFNSIMADRVAVLSVDASRRKRKCSPKTCAYTSSFHQQRQDAKQASLGKFQRTDTDRVKEQFTRNTQDSAQTGYNSPDSQLSEQELEAQEDIDGGSGTEVDGPIADDKYIKGTRLVVGGWFQACRGCNEPTAHSAAISKREVPLCPRCQDKYMAMVTGCYPPSSAVKSGAIEPLHYWLPRLLAPVPRLTPEQRRDFCDTLVLCQDDAWLQLINMS